MADTQFRPDRGGVTFDSEGNEGGKYHSRKLHVPGSTSGLTIGRGYDMGAKTAAQITTDLTAAGVELAMAKTLSGAATLRGENAKKFIWPRRSFSRLPTRPRRARRGGSVSEPRTMAPATGTSSTLPSRR